MNKDFETLYDEGFFPEDIKRWLKCKHKKWIKGFAAEVGFPPASPFLGLYPEIAWRTYQAIQCKKCGCPGEVLQEILVPRP